jgi:hypothetical protein
MPNVAAGIKKRPWFKGIGEYRNNKSFNFCSVQSVKSILSFIFVEIR